MAIKLKIGSPVIGEDFFGRVRDGEQYKFRSPLLRDYWKETYC